MQTVHDVLKAMKSKNRTERARIASQYPNIATSTSEEIYAAALTILSAEQLEQALAREASGSGQMSGELEQALRATMEAYESLPKSAPAKPKTIEYDDKGNIAVRPGRPTAEAKRLMEEARKNTQDDDLVRDPHEERAAFNLVRQYVKKPQEGDEDWDD